MCGFDSRYLCIFLKKYKSIYINFQKNSFKTKKFNSFLHPKINIYYNKVSHTFPNVLPSYSIMTTGYKPSNKSKLISKSKSTKYYKNISNTYNKLSKNHKIKYIQFKFHNVPCYWLNNTQYLNNVKFNITSTNSSRYYFNKIINIKKKQFFINYLFTFTVNYKHTQTNFIPFMFYKM